jgi:hypothetical protein
MKYSNHPSIQNRIDLQNKNENLSHYLGDSQKPIIQTLTDAHFDSEVV